MKLLPAASLLLLFVVPDALSQDNPECAGKTFSFFTTFDGYFIGDCKESEFGSYQFWLDGSSRFVEKKGKYRKVWFRKKSGSTRKVSGLQIIQNHMNAILGVKGEVVKGSDDCIYKTTYQGNDLWIHLKVYAGNADVDNFGMFSIESQPLRQEVTAVGIKGSIDSQGKVALYGILFDTGKSEIKPESEKELKEVAAYLKGSPAVSVIIVGHTDSDGDVAANLALSKGRSASVKQFLISKYAIDAKRLSSDGVGSLCPVSTNETEAGKKMNRRVEIVKK